MEDRNETGQSPRKQKAYVQIADEIRSRIESEELVPGDKLPVERELSRHFNVSRMTVRHALEVLEKEGLLDRRIGRSGGTFVKAEPPQLELSRMEGFMPQLRNKGRIVHSEVLLKTLESAGLKQARGLGISEYDAVFRVVRLRYVDNKPMLIEDSYFPAVDFPNLFDFDLSQSLYELLTYEFQRRPVSKRETVSPSLPSSWEKNQLRVRPTEPVLRIERIANDRFGKPIEYSLDVLRADFAKIDIFTNT